MIGAIGEDQRVIGVDRSGSERSEWSEGIGANQSVSEVIGGDRSVSEWIRVVGGIGVSCL